MAKPVKTIKEFQFTLLTQELKIKSTSLKFQKIKDKDVCLTLQLVVEADQLGEAGTVIPITSDSCGVFDFTNEFFSENEPVVNLENDKSTNLIKVVSKGLNILSNGPKGEHGIAEV